VQKQSLTFPDRDLFWAAPGILAAVLFLIFVREERASEMIKSKIQLLFQRGTEASSSPAAAGE